MRLVVTGFLLAALSCGGGSGGGASSTGSATYSGPLHGQTFVPRDAISANVPHPAGTAGVVVLTDATGLCAQFTAGKAPKNSRFLVLTAFVEQPSGTSVVAPSAPGIYTINGIPMSGFAVFAGIGANCEDLGPNVDEFGNSGTLTFTSVTGRYAGSFDLGYDGGDHGTGSFDAANCPALAKFTDPSQRSTLSCQ